MKPMRNGLFLLLLGLGACSYEGAMNAVRGLNGIPNPVDPVVPPLPKIDRTYPQFQLSLDSYEDCAALQSDIRARLEERRAEEKKLRDWQRSRREIVAENVAGSAQGDIAPAAMPGKDAETFTNTQEKSVDEADAFKVGTRHLFTAVQGRIEVIARPTLKSLGSLETDGLRDVAMYAGGDRLLVIGSPAGGGTEVRVYDSSSADLPTLTVTKAFSSRLLDSRLLDTHLVLVFSDSLRIEDPAFPGTYNARSIMPSGWAYGSGDLEAQVPEAPVLVSSEGKIGDIPCNKIVKQTVKDWDFRLTKVVAVDVDSPDLAEKSLGILGGGDEIYMSASSLYVIKKTTDWYWWWRGEGETLRVPPEQTVLTHVGFDRQTGEVSPRATGAIPGRVKDQWAFKDYADKGVLAVATSTGWQWGPEPAQNHLWILAPNDKTHSLDVVGAVRDFGTNEDIRSVRYVDDVAYIVTFRSIDPLFAFDLSDPRAPRLLGELKVPGFSAYMHPVAGDLLVGVGFDDGLQISLFDRNDPTQLARVANQRLGDQGSSSEVTRDHHAFFYDEASALIAVPAVVFARSSSAPTFSGAIFYGIDDQLKERARISHGDLIPTVCRNQMAYDSSLDISRVFKVDGKYVSMSRFGAKVHPLEHPEQTLQAVVYERGETLCPMPGFCGNDLIMPSLRAPQED